MLIAAYCLMKDFRTVIIVARGSACDSLQVLPKTQGTDSPACAGMTFNGRFGIKNSVNGRYTSPICKQNRLQAESDFSTAGSLY